MNKPKDIVWEIMSRTNEEPVGENEDELEEKEQSPMRAIQIPIMNQQSEKSMLIDSLDPIYNTEYMVGHTNFTLSEEHILLIEKAEGVEYLIPQGRYRFVVGCGVMFSAEEVQKNVELALGVDKELDLVSQNTEVAAIVEEIKSKNRENKFLLGYIYPNGSYSVFNIQSQEEYDEQKSKMGQYSRLSNGIIVS